MAEARKCDRCHEFYELSKEDQSRRDWPADAKGTVARLFLRTSTDDRGEWYDLCPKCVDSLKGWLEQPKIVKEIENEIYSQCCVPKELLTGPPIYKGAVDFADSMSDPYEESEYKDPCKSCQNGVCEQCVYGYCSEEDKKKRWLERHKEESKLSDPYEDGGL